MISDQLLKLLQQGSTNTGEPIFVSVAATSSYERGEFSLTGPVSGVSFMFRLRGYFSPSATSLHLQSYCCQADTDHARSLEQEGSCCRSCRKFQSHAVPLYSPLLNTVRDLALLNSSLDDALTRITELGILESSLLTPSLSASVIEWVARMRLFHPATEPFTRTFKPMVGRLAYQIQSAEEVSSD